MRVLGVDCGSVATGYGVIESDGRKHRSLTSGTIRAAKRVVSFAERLHAIHCRLTDLLLEFQPDWVAIEEVFYAQNVNSALKLGHVRGVAMQAAAARAVPVAEYSALAIKSAVAGYGRAEKQQVMHMVRVLLALDVDPDSFDASDALAVAICHVHTIGTTAVARAATASR